MKFEFTEEEKRKIEQDICPVCNKKNVQTHYQCAMNLSVSMGANKSLDEQARKKLFKAYGG